jgi:hypothetical protein
MVALFEKAQFDKAAQFRHVAFAWPNWFDTAQFNGEEPDFSGSGVRDPGRDQRWPPSWQIEPPAGEGKLALLVRSNA